MVSKRFIKRTVCANLAEVDEHILFWDLPAIYVAVIQNIAGLAREGTGATVGM